MADDVESPNTRDLIDLLATGVFAAVLLGVVFRTSPAQLGASQFGIIAVAAAGLILAPIRGRLREFKFGPEGVSAKLDEIKKEALAAVSAEVGPDVAATIQPQIERASSRGAVEAIRGAAVAAGQVKLNALNHVGAIVQAIQERKKVRIRYAAPPDGVPVVHEVIPIDLQTGRTERTAAKDYVWVYSQSQGRPISLLLSRVLDVEVLPEGFDPRSIHLPEPTHPRQIQRDW